MSCVALEQLAHAATDDNPRVLAHVASCPRCAALLDEQRSIRALVHAMPPARLPADRRAELAAEVMAQAERIEPARHPGRFAIAAGSGVAVAVLAIVLATRGQRAEVPEVAIAHEVPGVRTSTRSTATEPAPAVPIAELRTVDADLSRDTTAERDVITLRGGSVSIDASNTRPVQIVAGTTRVAVARARASVVARAGAIEQVAVFAGSVEVTANGTRHVIVAGETWERLPHPVPPAQPAGSLTAFREGWTQLRANNHAAAIAAFDRAIDPVVAEDAVYWAAVAAERAGTTDDARRRFTDFVARFPASPRAEAARAAIARLH